MNAPVSQSAMSQLNTAVATIYNAMTAISDADAVFFSTNMTKMHRQFLASSPRYLSQSILVILALGNYKGL